MGSKLSARRGSPAKPPICISKRPPPVLPPPPPPPWPANTIPIHVIHHRPPWYPPTPLDRNFVLTRTGPATWIWEWLNANPDGNTIRITLDPVAHTGHVQSEMAAGYSTSYAQHAGWAVAWGSTNTYAIVGPHGYYPAPFNSEHYFTL